MAKKKPTIKGLFDKTDQDRPQAYTGKRRPIGVYLRQPTHEALLEIAQAEELNPHSLIAYAVTYFIREYRAGRAVIETESKPQPKLDL
jgi:hypothetical protein